MLDALRALSEEKKQARVTHAWRVVRRFDLLIRTKLEVDRYSKMRSLLLLGAADPLARLAKSNPTMIPVRIPVMNRRV